MDKISFDEMEDACIKASVNNKKVGSPDIFDVKDVRCLGCGLDSTMGNEMCLEDFQCRHCGWTPS